MVLYNHNQHKVVIDVALTNKNIYTMWGPLVISWFTSLDNYSYKNHKP